MATPVGHSLVAGLFYLAGKKDLSGRALDLPLMLVYIMFSNAPDLDFLPGLVLGDRSAFHRGMSHSFAFGLIFTVVVAVAITRIWKHFGEYGLPKLILVGFLIYSSHLLVDLVTLDNSVPYGMPLLWPFSGQYPNAPLYILPNVLHGGGEFSLHNWMVALREIIIFGPPLLYLMMVNRHSFTPIMRLWGLSITVYVGVVLALLVSPNPYYQSQ